MFLLAALASGSLGCHEFFHYEQAGRRTDNGLVDAGRPPDTALGDRKSPDGGPPDIRLDASVKDAFPAPDARPIGPFGSLQAVSELNVLGDVDDPSLTGDMLEIYFCLTKDGVEAIWRARRASITDSWNDIRLDEELNTVGINSTPEITPDGLRLYFSSNRRDLPSGETDFRLFEATRADRAVPWSEPVPLKVIHQSGSHEVCPAPAVATVPPLLVYELRDLTGRSAVLVQTQQATAQDAWQVVRHLDELNEQGYPTTSPWLDTTGTVIYYGFGPLAFYGFSGEVRVTVRSDTGSAFAQPSVVEGLACQIEGSTYCGDPWLSPDQKTIYFTRRIQGKWEIYLATRL